MRNLKAVFFTLVVSAIALGFGCRNASTGEPKTLLDKTVSVGASGGYAEVSFEALKGQKVKIELTAASETMEPYGHLKRPGGKEEYRPAIETAKNAVNASDFIADKKGRYGLTVFDGSNLGGKVTVTVTAE